MVGSAPRLQLSDDDTIGKAELVQLYDAVGWAAYTANPGSLAGAVSNSTYVVTARCDGHIPVLRLSERGRL